jgi:hypothetical protein
MSSAPPRGRESLADAWAVSSHPINATKSPCRTGQDMPARQETGAADTDRRCSTRSANTLIATNSCGKWACALPPRAATKRRAGRPIASRAANSAAGIQQPEDEETRSAASGHTDVSQVPAYRELACRFGIVRQRIKLPSTCHNQGRGPASSGCSAAACGLAYTANRLFVARPIAHRPTAPGPPGIICVMPLVPPPLARSSEPT